MPRGQIYSGYFCFQSHLLLQVQVVSWELLSISEKACFQVSCSSTACDWLTVRKRSHSDSIQLTDKWSTGSDYVATLHCYFTVLYCVDFYCVLLYFFYLFSLSVWFCVFVYGPCCLIQIKWWWWWLLLLYRAWQLYGHDVVAGSKARIAGCCI